MAPDPVIAKRKSMVGRIDDQRILIHLERFKRLDNPANPAVNERCLGKIVLQTVSIIGQLQWSRKTFVRVRARFKHTQCVAINDSLIQTFTRNRV